MKNILIDSAADKIIYEPSHYGWDMQASPIGDVTHGQTGNVINWRNRMQENTQRIALWRLFAGGDAKLKNPVNRVSNLIIYRERPDNVLEVPCDPYFLAPLQEAEVSIDVEYHTLKLPQALYHLYDVITNAKSIVELEDDWDGLGAIRIDARTLDSAFSFLIGYANEVFYTYGVSIKAPEINPCPDGSIDLVWRSKHARLLVNIKPYSSMTYASGYGDLGNDVQPLRFTAPNSAIISHVAFWMKNLA